MQELSDLPRGSPKWLRDNSSRAALDFARHDQQLEGMPLERIMTATTNDEVIALLRELMRQGDYVLIKGSRGAAMEGIVAALQRQP